MRKYLAILLFLATANAFGQSAPPAYVLPASDKAIIVLANTSRNVHSFQVYRKGENERDFSLMTPEPVGPAADAAEAVALMGKDFQWIARKMDSIDPQVVWRKLRLDRNMADAYALLSHGLRMALGKTWVDTRVSSNQRYQYRILMLDTDGNEVQRYERRIRITDPDRPEAPNEVETEYDDGLVSITWGYPPFEGGTEDRTVGFIIFRRRGSGEFVPLFPAPVLRIEGHLTAFDENVRMDESYTYGIVAIDIIGAASARVDSPSLLVEDSTIPLVPVGLKATDRGEDVLLIWKMSPELDVSHYNVYRSFSVDEEAELIRVNSEPIPYEQPRLVDSEAPRGVPIYYRVSAFDKRGNESPLSGPAPILAEDKTPPAAVTGLEATVDEEERTVALSWTAPDDPDLTGFYVYSGSDPARMMRLTGKPVSMDSSARNEPKYTDRGYLEKGLEPGKSLHYGVSAVDHSYNEGPTEIVEVQIPDNVPPEAPHGFAVRPSRDGAVRLSWQPLLAFDLASYRVYRADEQDFSAVADLGNDQLTWMDREIERGRRYRYTLTALDTSGNESDRSREIEIVPTDLYPPPPPSVARAEADNRGVRLTWEPCPENDVKGYRIYRSDFPGGTPNRSVAAMDDELEYLDRKGRAGLVYGISTIDTSGNEGALKEVTAQ